MSRLLQLSSICRVAGVPVISATRRLSKNPISPAHSLVTVAGCNEVISPLFAEDQLPELIAVIRAQPPKQVTIADAT